MALTNNDDIETDDIRRLLRQIFETALQTAFRAASERLASWVSADTVADSLNALIAFILQCDNPEPLWRDVQSAVGDKHSQNLVALAQTNQIGWIDRRDGQEYWRWKHNRLRDIIIGKWLATNVLRSVDDEISAENHSLLHNPGLAEAFALAFVYLKQNILPALAHIGSYQPRTLAELLSLNLFPAQTDYREAIALHLRNALVEKHNPREEFVESPQTTLLGKLSEINEPLILDILPLTEESSWASQIARFRNGDLEAGIKALNQVHSGPLFAQSRFPFFEKAIEDFGSCHEKQRHLVAEQLANNMQSVDTNQYVLYIASQLGWLELLEPLWAAWSQKSIENQKQTAAAVVWFLSNLETEAIVPKLRSAFLMVLELSNVREKEHYASERYVGFIDSFAFSPVETCYFNCCLSMDRNYHFN